MHSNTAGCRVFIVSDWSCSLLLLLSSFWHLRKVWWCDSLVVSSSSSSFALFFLLKSRKYSHLWACGPKRILFFYRFFSSRFYLRPRNICETYWFELFSFFFRFLSPLLSFRSHKFFVLFFFQHMIFILEREREKKRISKCKQSEAETLFSKKKKM